MFIFPVQLTTSRIGNLTYQVDSYSASSDYHTASVIQEVMVIHTYIQFNISATNSLLDRVTFRTNSPIPADDRR